ncbi:hypothetical protein [Weissella tructae]
MLKVTIEMTAEEYKNLDNEYANEDMGDTSFTEMSWDIAERVLTSSEIKEV